MRKHPLSLLTAALACALILNSCDDENEPVETLLTGFMTAHTDSEGYISSIDDDFGTHYRVSEKKDKLSPDTTLRIVASAALDDSHNVRILQMVQALSYIAPPDSIIPDTMRVKDPIEIESLYIGGGYLNIHVGIKVGSEDARHTLFYTRLDSPGKLKFTFYHNSYDDRGTYTRYAYVSIPLWGYLPSKNDTVFLSCKGYQEDYDYKLIYK